MEAAAAAVDENAHDFHPSIVGLTTIATMPEANEKKIQGILRQSHLYEHARQQHPKLPLDVTIGGSNI